LQSLAKDDIVKIYGGITGTVVEVKGDWILLREDNANKTWVEASAIRKKLKGQSSGVVGTTSKKDGKVKKKKPKPFYPF